MRELGKKMAGMKVYWLIVALVVLGLCLEYTTKADAHVTSASHNTAHTFQFDYNAQFGVYCGWRHGYEGISCVSVHE